jgi:hypothetical protein
MKITQQWKPDSNNCLETAGWDPTFEVTELEIRSYFTPKNFDFMFGGDWRRFGDYEIEYDFDSYIAAAIAEAEARGLLK